jgi:hypothetical protein
MPIIPRDCHHCRGDTVVCCQGETYYVECTNLDCLMTGPIAESHDQAVAKWDRLSHGASFAEAKARIDAYVNQFLTRVAQASEPAS